MYCTENHQSHRNRQPANKSISRSSIQNNIGANHVRYFQKRQRNIYFICTAMSIRIRWNRQRFHGTITWSKTICQHIRMRQPSEPQYRVFSFSFRQRLGIANCAPFGLVIYTVPQHIWNHRNIHANMRNSLRKIHHLRTNGWTSDKKHSMCIAKKRFKKFKNQSFHHRHQ